MTGPGRQLSSPATDAATALLGEFVRLGVRHIVVSPGSRSQALALVAADLARRGIVRLHVRVDERVGGFTALGIGRELRMPAIALCTSGTAAAGYLPAALEAHHSGIPLILLTADRPPEFRGIGANQTTRQPGMYAPTVRFEADLPVPEAVDDDGTDPQTAMLRDVAGQAFSAALGEGTRAAGPVHVNLPFREPLSGELPEWAPETVVAAVAGPDTESPNPELEGVDADDAASGALYQGGGGIGAADVALEPDPDPLVLERGPRTVVVAGADAGPDAEQLAFAGSWPLIAEIVSGARFGRYVVHGYRSLLRDAELGGRIERAVVFGHPTLSRELVGLLSQPEVDVIALRGPGEPLGLNGATIAADAVRVAGGDADREWLAQWLAASAAAAVDLDPPAPDSDGLSSASPRERRDDVAAELEAVRRPLDRQGLVDAVWRATWPHDRLMFGSSRLVRVADDVLGGKKVPVHANRGLAGIDGTVATATGIAVSSQDAGRPGVTRVLIGDLALLHDVGALLMPPGEVEPRLQVIVGNDGGGTIFDGLEVASVAPAEDMDRVMYTPQAVRLEQLALAYGWGYTLARTRAELDQALLSPAGRRVLIEVPLER